MSTSLRKKLSNCFRPAASVEPPTDHTTEKTKQQSTKMRCSFSDMVNSSSSLMRNSSMRDSKMFISAKGRLMSDVGISSLQFLRTNRMLGSTSHAKSSSRRSLCGSSRGGSVFIHDCLSGSQPISEGST